jgi:hypothetical protein
MNVRLPIKYPSDFSPTYVVAFIRNKETFVKIDKWKFFTPEVRRGQS